MAFKKYRNRSLMPLEMRPLPSGPEDIDDWMASKGKFAPKPQGDIQTLPDYPLGKPPDPNTDPKGAMNWLMNPKPVKRGNVELYSQPLGLGFAGQQPLVRNPVLDAQQAAIDAQWDADRRAHNQRMAPMIAASGGIDVSQPNPNVAAWQQVYGTPQRQFDAHQDANSAAQTGFLRGLGAGTAIPRDTSTPGTPGYIAGLGNAAIARQDAARAQAEANLAAMNAKWNTPEAIARHNAAQQGYAAWNKVAGKANSDAYANTHPSQEYLDTMRQRSAAMTAFHPQPTPMDPEVLRAMRMAHAAGLPAQTLPAWQAQRQMLAETDPARMVALGGMTGLPAFGEKAQAGVMENIGDTARANIMAGGHSKEPMLQTQIGLHNAEQRALAMQKYNTWLASHKNATPQQKLEAQQRFLSEASIVDVTGNQSVPPAPQANPMAGPLAPIEQTTQEAPSWWNLPAKIGAGLLGTAAGLHGLRWLAPRVGAFAANSVLPEGKKILYPAARKAAQAAAAETALKEGTKKAAGQFAEVGPKAVSETKLLTGPAKAAAATGAATGAKAASWLSKAKNAARTAAFLGGPYGLAALGLDLASQVPSWLGASGEFLNGPSEATTSRMKVAQQAAIRAHAARLGITPEEYAWAIKGFTQTPSDKSILSRVKNRRASQ